ncbi:MAG: hypothetical protein RIA71_12765 [Oceanicaulis sp.]
MRTVSGGTVWLDYRRLDDGSMWGSTGEQAQRERTFAMITGIGPVYLGSEAGESNSTMAADLQAMEAYDQYMDEAAEWRSNEFSHWDTEYFSSNQD